MSETSPSKLNRKVGINTRTVRFFMLYLSNRDLSTINQLAAVFPQIVGMSRRNTPSK